MEGEQQVHLLGGAAVDGLGLVGAEGLLGVDGLPVIESIGLVNAVPVLWVGASSRQMASLATNVSIPRSSRRVARCGR